MRNIYLFIIIIFFVAEITETLVILREIFVTSLIAAYQDDELR
jgi:hypothetical protein